MCVNNRWEGTWTTVVVAVVSNEHIRIANIGDSGAYVISRKQIRRITVDHSVVEELVQNGSITREEARNHPDKNIITRALGTEAYVNADYYDYVPNDGEVILMCSDGLSEMVEDKDIRRLVNASDNINDAVKALIDEANGNGGADNITVIALRFKKEENV